MDPRRVLGTLVACPRRSQRRPAPASAPRAHGPRRRSLAAALAVALTGALLAAACTTSGDGDLAQATSNERSPADAGNVTPGGLRWTGCLSDASRAADLECAALTVPVSRSDPDGDTLELELARLPHRGPERIGSLLVNPGGPGGSGIEFLTSAAAVMPGQLTDALRPRHLGPAGGGREHPGAVHRRRREGRPDRGGHQPRHRGRGAAGARRPGQLPRGLRGRRRGPGRAHVDRGRRRRPRGDPRGAGGGPAQLPRLLLRDGDRRHLRHRVPRAGAGDGARRRGVDVR